MKKRIDTLLVELNHCTSRQLAQRLIQAGEVLVNTQVVDKPGTEIDINSQITIKQRSRFVSRGGEKLAKALVQFNIDVTDKICLDGGISTGGFTDCLLQSGAKQIYGIDVGYGQVDWKIRSDSRVILKERTNLRYLTPQELYPENALIPDFGVVDVSFISLTKILPSLWQLLTAPRQVVLLVKPQFEVGKEKVGKKGVVRDAKDQANAIAQVLQSALELGWKYRSLTFSPITGPAGNIEYLLWLNMDSDTPNPDIHTIHNITINAQIALTNSQ
jgi:23S rRNA (cytidine1920-2'-O)/16S rRNA (cytidine1409-2'-O)-methyltransferase